MTDVRRHILVLPDRDAAEDVAEELSDRFGDSAPAPQVVREALAGEDDAEDAQWLVVLEAPEATGAGGVSSAPVWDAERLDALAAEYDGWLERE